MGQFAVSCHGPAQLLACETSASELLQQGIAAVVWSVVSLMFLGSVFQGEVGRLAISLALCLLKVEGIHFLTQLVCCRMEPAYSSTVRMSVDGHSVCGHSVGGYLCVDTCTWILCVCG